MKKTLAALALVAMAATVPAFAQFATVPAPQCQTPPPSGAEAEREYRKDAARHLYRCYPQRIMRGKMPPMLYGVMIVETEIDPSGQLVDVRVVRKPAADEVGPWVLAMIRRAAPFPAPMRLSSGSARFTEIWLVDKSGQFQVDSLTEGQN